MAETLARLLADARRRLRDANVGDEALDARLLLQQATGLTHAEITAEPERAIAGDHILRFERMIARRLLHEPVSRILGGREFYGRVFGVTPDVLDPRPDTETLVEAALALLGPGMRVLDLGAGSGAVIVTLLAERPGLLGATVDLSHAALAVGIENAHRHGVADRLTALAGSWFEPVTGYFDLIVSNPPYIPTGDIAGLEADVRNYDPHSALAGGDDGLEAYRAIAAGAGDHLTTEGQIMVEIGAGQAEMVCGIFEGQGYVAAGQWRDLGGHVRVLAFAQG
jgi:release factor glutamine methyltransferase